AVNERVADEPEIINSDPYDGGWTCTLELTDFSEDKELLMDCDKYYEYLKEKVRKEHEQVYGE
ncbi:MAG: glycine cleavage system protein H, partial [Actinobacteria bacterium]|nr:glycine cleavage system protein H [Actinomycetota bacterium]